ncbi:MAG: alpha-galactosidase [Phycisphaerae bacterium]|nr:alpha-galactosidase [Phycisphaerae bacterium]
MTERTCLLILGMATCALFGTMLNAAEPTTLKADDAKFTAAEPPTGAMWADSLDLKNMPQDYSWSHAGVTIEDKPLTLNGQVYRHGIGTHANSEMIVNLKGMATRFESVVGVDDEKKGKGSVVFAVWVDGNEIARTPVLRGGDKPQVLSVDLTGAKELLLVVEDANDGIDSDHADWAGALITLVPNAKEKPVSVKPQQITEAPPRIAMGTPPEPAIHAPRITGATPGRPFLFRIPATGSSPLKYTVKNLPAGLTIDSATGIITGSLKGDGETAVEVTVENSLGRTSSTLTIVGGQHKLALTPPLGWNSWNCWAGAVDDAKVRAAADAMIASGLANHGFTYINIDDTWEAGTKLEGQKDDEVGPARDEQGRMLCNKKFPDMKALADYVHSKGLKLGIYSSPGPKTCAGFEGSYQHEELDARRWAEWGIDLVKYDWCSYGGIAPNNSLEELQKPYHVMREALDKANRDIVYSLCQYGMGRVWEWGAKVGGNYWRTTGDINDSWSSMSGIGFSQDSASPYAGPGHWNDPDMLVVGKVGWGPSLHPTRLTPNEQVTHITLWSLLASPLLIGCDMSEMDDFTLALLTNPEVLEVNQDVLGKAARRLVVQGRCEVWARPLADGTMAVGLFNRNRADASVTVQWSDLKLSGRQPVRNLWLRENVGTYEDSYATSVPRHGAIMLKIGTPRKK